MAKYSEIVALLEYFDKKTIKPAATKKSFSKKMRDKEFDPVDYLTKERAKLERFEKYLKDYDKLSKKDDKKDDKKSSFTWYEIYILAAVSYPLFGLVSQHLPAVLK